MNNDSIRSAIETSLGKRVALLSSLGGGCISSTYAAAMKDGTHYFVKAGPEHPDMFITEAHGLEELRKTGAIRVPTVIAADRSVLILEMLCVSSPPDRRRFFDTFGRRFARMHRTTANTFGFFEDNYIGSTPQKNTRRSSSWKEFYLTQRLEFQFHLAESNGYVDEGMAALFRKLVARIDAIIPDDGEPPALLHGDLWGGNFLCLDGTTPALIDPAVYYGHREADIAMTLLFGGFDDAFYSAYTEEYPLVNGWKERIPVYTLYHLFNHLNLFGEGYYGQVMETMRRSTK